MKAKLVQELFEKYFRKTSMKDKIKKYENPKNAERLSSPYGYYDMCNALSISKVVIPELKGSGIRFQYSPYANFLVILCSNDDEAHLVEQILEDDGEGDRFDNDSIEWHLANDEEFSDTAYIANINDNIDF